jgi:HPr kinase/phosphorylase
MALGAELVADDRTVLSLHDTGLIASCPASIRGRIEARGVGLLAADTVARACVVLAVDLGAHENERLPPLRHMIVLGHSIVLLHTPQNGHFPAAILQYLKGGRSA